MFLRDFLSQEAGQDRRKWLNETLGSLIAPEVRPWVEAAGEINPVTSMERAGQGAARVADPNVQGWDKVKAVGDTASNMGAILAPAALAGKSGMPAANAIVEALTAASPMKGAVGDFAASEFGGVGFADDAASRGAEIMAMLKSGRGAEVTDDMLDMGDATMNARLNEWLFNNYDLPMDAGSRAARAESSNFNIQTPLYRGDENPNLSSFSTGRLAREGIGVTTSDSPNVAATYMTGDTPAMYPLYSKSRNPLSLDAKGRNWTGIPADARANESTLDALLPPENYLDEDNLFDFQNGVAVDWGDGSSTDLAIANTNDVSRAAQIEGFDEVRFRNIVDRGGAGQFHTGPANDPHTTVMTSDPRNIRSRFARFDPRLAHLRNLSAGVAGLLPLSAYLNDDNQQ